MNSVDPDQMPQLAASELGLHCLHNTPKQVSGQKKGLRVDKILEGSLYPGKQIGGHKNNSYVKKRSTYTHTPSVLNTCTVHFMIFFLSPFFPGFCITMMIH